MITNGVPAGTKGKAVEIHHYLFDELWNVGTRQIDASILLASPADQSEEEKKEDEATQIKQQKQETTNTEPEANDVDDNAPAQQVDMSQSN